MKVLTPTQGPQYWRTAKGTIYRQRRCAECGDWENVDADGHMTTHGYICGGPYCGQCVGVARGRNRYMLLEQLPDSTYRWRRARKPNHAPAEEVNP